MKIERLPNDELEVVKSNNGLRLYLNKLQDGRPHTPRSWLYETVPDTEVLQEWLQQLNAVKSTPYGELVYQFELSQMGKWGPQGGIKPIKELMALLEEGFSQAASPQPALFRTKEWQAAKRDAVEYLTRATGWMALTPRSFAKVIDDMRARDTLESNSGWPSFTRRNKPEIAAQAIADAQSGKWREYPAIVLFRDYRQKTRPVWMYPMSTNLVEGSFCQPLKDAIMRSRDTKFFAPWRGYEHVLASITADYDDGMFLSASDFSHTDAHFTKWHMLEVYDVVKMCFQAQYWPLLKESMLRVCSIPLVIGPDTKMVGDHGVSSGSNWTNDVETYLDLIFEFLMERLRVVSGLADAIGDDIRHKRLTFDPSAADKLAELYQQANLDVNAQKVTNERDWIKYLQRLTIRGYRSTRRQLTTEEGKPLLRGIYSTVRALNSLLWPEKFHSPKLWNKQMFAARTFMILENCVDHPLFDQFVRFVVAGNSYLPEFATLAATDLNNVTRESQRIPGLNPSYNQEKRGSSLATFASIQIAREL